MKFLSLTLILIAGCSNYTDFANSATESLARTTHSVSDLLDDSTDHRIQLISGDFNGDGWLDNVYISAIDKDDWTLVFHSDVLNDGSPDITLLIEHSPSTNLEEIVLTSLPSGKYKTLCASYDEYCQSGNPKEVTLTHEAIQLRILEASLSIIYWDKKINKFNRVWLSD